MACGIPWRGGYHAVWDTTAWGIPWRVGCHGVWDTTVASGAQRLIGQDAALVECRDRRLEGQLSALAGCALEAFRFPVRCPCSLACPLVSAARWGLGALPLAPRPPAGGCVRCLLSQCRMACRRKSPPSIRTCSSCTSRPPRSCSSACTITARCDASRAAPCCNTTLRRIAPCSSASSALQHASASSQLGSHTRRYNGGIVTCDSRSGAQLRRFDGCTRFVTTLQVPAHICAGTDSRHIGACRTHCPHLRQDCTDRSAQR